MREALSRRTPALVGTGGLLVLVIGLIAALTIGPDPAAPAPPAAPRAAPPGAGAPPPVVDAPAVVPPQPSRATRLDGRARSVELLSARVTAGRRVTLRGTLSAGGYAEGVVDGAGRSLGAGSVSAEDDVVLRSAGPIALDVATLLVRPGGVEVPESASTFDGEIVARGGRLQVAARSLMFTPGTAGAQPRRVAGGIVTLPEGTDVSVRPRSRVVWVDAPATLAVTPRPGARMSWAGSGSVRPPGRPALRGRYLGVRSDELALRLGRSPGGVRIAGTADPATQLYVDGSPRLGTTASVRVFDELLKVDRTDGDDDRFTWAPRNTGAADMLITRVRPLNGPGRWVQLRLAPVPAAFGGEARPPVGGDTSGLGKGTSCILFCTGAKAIRSELPIGDADRRDLTVTPPADVQPGRYLVLLRVEGNFPPVTVRVPVQVVR